MIDDLVPGTVEARGEMRLRTGHPDRVRDALAEWSGRRFDTGGQVIFRMAGGRAAPLTKPFDLLQRQVVSAQVEKRIQQHGTVSCRQHEAVAVWPARIRRA